MRNYLKLKCSICGRSKDAKVDTRTTKFPKCSITLGCAGILKPYQYTDNPDTIPDASPVGVQNWYSRFKSVTTFSDATSSEVLLSYGTRSEMYIAVRFDAEPELDDSYKLSVSLTSPTLENKQFREYVFNTTSQIDRLLGVESGVGRKVLRFISTGSTPDEIKVLKNGVLVTEGHGEEQYQISRTSNTIPQNTIVFNSAVRGTNQFKVIVSRPVAGRTQVVEFDKLTQTDVVDSCWGNVDRVSFRNNSFHIFHKNFVGVPLSSGQIFSITAVDLVKDGAASIPLSDCMVLISGGPTHVDRTLTAVVKLDTLAQVTFPFTATKLDEVVVVKLSETLVSEIFPPLNPKTFTNEPLIQTSVSNDITDSLSYTSIISPLN